MGGNQSTLGFAGVLAFVTLSGCAHVQLRWNTTHQAKTLTEIYELQVLDNLARFVIDPNSLPWFAYPNEGGADVTDTPSLSSDTTWNRLGFSSQLLKIGASRGMKEGWTLTPIYDVRRLELMRCAYQYALHSAGLCPFCPTCPDCDRLQRAFYVGDPVGKYNSDDTMPDNLATFSMSTGRTTPACFRQVSWLGCGKRSCVPKNSRCLKKGHYCGVYVWVLPGGQDELTKLTLTILDYAFSTQATKTTRTKQVVWYFDEEGKPTPQANAAQVMSATLPFDAKVRLNTPQSIMPLDMNATPESVQAAIQDAERRSQQLRDSIDLDFQRYQGRGYELPPILPQPNWFSPLNYELRRSTLTSEFVPPTL